MSIGVAEHLRQCHILSAICSLVDFSSQCRQCHSEDCPPKSGCSATPLASGFAEQAGQSLQIASRTFSAPVKLTTEFTKAATNYCDLHKHAAAQDALVRHEAIALRLTAAYMIGQSHLWTIRTEKGRADNPETKASVDASASRASFESSKGEAFDLLGVDEEDRPECLSDSSWQGAPVAEVFAKLCAMKDSEVLTLMAIAMAEMGTAVTK
jgi:hypothetical protein